MNIGIIGIGGRSRPYSIVPQLIREDVRIAALVRRDMEKLKEYANTYFTEADMPRLYTDYNEVLDDPSIEAVVICTPDATHREIATLALRKGKHVLLEKPFATTLEDTIELYNETLKHDKVLRLAFLIRYSTMFQKIKEIVSSGILGQIINVEAKEMLSLFHSVSYFRRWNRFKHISGGFLNAKSSHDMDMLNWVIDSEPVYLSAFGGRAFFNPKKEAADRCKNCKLRHECKYDFYTYEKQNGWFGSREDLCVFNVENDLVDHETLNIEYQNGVIALFTVTMFGGEPGRSLRIYGTEATLTAYSPYEGYGKPNIKINYIEPKDEVIFNFDADFGEKYNWMYSDADIGICANFIDSIRTDKYPEKSDARAGLLSSAMALAAEVSMVEKKVINIQELINKR